MTLPHLSPADPDTSEAVDGAELRVPASSLAQLKTDLTATIDKDVPASSLAQLKTDLTATIDKDVAALWRLLDTASQIDTDPALEAYAEGRETSAQTLRELLSNLTQKPEPEAKQAPTPPVQTEQPLTPEARLDLALDTSPEGLKFCEQSTGLNAAMLYHLIFEGREATQIAVAKRADLLSEHVDALISRPSFLVAWQVLKNRRLHLTPAQIEALTRLSLKHTALRLPLVARPELGEHDALKLTAVVSPDLQSGLKQRFPNLDMAYPQTVGIATHVKPELEHTETPFLVNCLSRGLLPAYARGIANRFGLNQTGLLAALQSPSYVPLALTLRALDIDRAAFNGLLRKRSQMIGQDAAEGHERLARAIFALTQAEAEARLKANPDFGPDFFKADRRDIG